MAEIWIVFACSGQWEDYYEQPIEAYMDEESAKLAAQHFTEQQKPLYEERLKDYEKFDWDAYFEASDVNFQSPSYPEEYAYRVSRSGIPLIVNEDASA